MNWKERIEKAEESGEFTALDMYLAGRWNRCAIGEKLSLTENWFSYEDSKLSPGIFFELSRLGILFADSVAIHNNPKQAARLYQLINEIKVK